MTNNTQEVPELLAPAGTPAAFYAALAAGADAIYLGVEHFNARRNAENFTLENLAAYCDLAHLAGRRIYLTLNIAILPNELSEALRVGSAAYEAGVDALIVQDLGLLSLLARELPDCELHASTQMNLHSSEAVLEAVASGASRVTLARELSLDEIAEIASTGVPLEVFAHGALCICHSGQCLFSSLVGRRSANRGLCAQACRLPYQLIDTSTGKRIKAPGEHLLSPADLSTIELLPQLVETGVSSLKLEGRMKDASYVGTVTHTYRDALDGLAVKPDALSEVFSRGFTTAYLEGERGNAMMSYTRPNNRGVAIGRVTSLDSGLVGVELSRPVTSGDVLEFWTARGNVAVVLNTYQEKSDGRFIKLVVDKPVSMGDRVFRVRNAEVLKAADDAREAALLQGNNGFVSVTAHVVAHLDEPLSISFTTADGTEQSASSESGTPLAAARSKALTADDVREHVGRVGGTVFTITDWEIDLEPGVGCGFSELHRVRARALDALAETLLAPWRTRRSTPLADPPALAPAPKGKPRVAVLVNSLASAQAALKAGADMLYTEGTTYLPAITHDHELERVLSAIPEDRSTIVANNYVSGNPASKHGTPEDRSTVVVNNLAELRVCRERDIPFEAGPSLGIYNPETLAVLARKGARQAWLSPELSFQDIRQLAPASPVPLALTVFGQQEVMVTEHCILMAQGPCNQDCAACSRRKAPRLLEDRKGYRFPVSTDDAGRSHLYNAIALDLIPSMPELVSLGLSTLVVDATLLNTKQIRDEVARAVRARDLAVKGAGSLPKREGFTTGHFFRGVL
ncbi:MAG: U32 family peptidase [Coriobacteriales bacterium]|jgi:putative protease|nr:U32 family peptidase [Coriobacteriales bacterium]